MFSITNVKRNENACKSFTSQEISCPLMDHVTLEQLNFYSTQIFHQPILIVQNFKFLYNFQQNILSRYNIFSKSITCPVKYSISFSKLNYIFLFKSQIKYKDYEFNVRPIIFIFHKRVHK